MKIALLSPWNTICGVSEFAHFLVEALEYRGHEVQVFANRFAGEYYPVGIRQDGPNVQRVFETGFQPDAEQRQHFNVIAIESYFTVKQPDVLLINYQDYVFCNKEALSVICSIARRFNVKICWTLHDSCISPSTPISPTDKVITPPSVTFSSGRTIDQGIPELHLPVREHSIDKPFWGIGCFGLGRNKTEALIKVVTEINNTGVLKKPIELLIQQGKPGEGYIHTKSGVSVRKGYLEAKQLGELLNYEDAVVIWYPDIQGQSTSSAFRFAVGSQVPIIANRSNWVADQKGNGCWIEVPDDDAGCFEDTIIGLFNEETYPLRRAQMEILQRQKIAECGWSEIARQYEEYLLE